jgi:hypothetical protein
MSSIRIQEIVKTNILNYTNPTTINPRLSKANITITSTGTATIGDLDLEDAGHTLIIYATSVSASETLTLSFTSKNWSYDQIINTTGNYSVYEWIGDKWVIEKSSGTNMLERIETGTWDFQQNLNQPYTLQRDGKLRTLTLDGRVGTTWSGDRFVREIGALETFDRPSDTIRVPWMAWDNSVWSNERVLQITSSGIVAYSSNDSIDNFGDFTNGVFAQMGSVSWTVP